MQEMKADNAAGLLNMSHCFSADGLTYSSPVLRLQMGLFLVTVIWRRASFTYPLPLIPALCAGETSATA